MKTFATILFLIWSASLSAQITNVSARTFIGSGTEAVELKFTLKTTGTPQVLIRAVGPELKNFGLPDVIPDPAIDLYQNGKLLGSNDDWDDANGLVIAKISAAAGAFGLSRGSADSALLSTLSAGTYTVKVFGVGGVTGAGLTEIFVSGAEGDSLTSLSLRSVINETSIGIVNNAPNQKFLFRLLGPALGTVGIANPVLKVAGSLHGPSEKTQDSNDNWGTDIDAGLMNAYASAANLDPLKDGSLDSAFILEIGRGVHVVTATGDGKLGRLEIANLEGLSPYRDRDRLRHIIGLILFLGILPRLVKLRNYSPQP